MSLAKMSASDRSIIFECLKAAAHGPFFNDADLRILLDVERSELHEIVARIPHLDDSDRKVRRIIGHVLLNLLGYPHQKHDEWNKWISVDHATVEQVDERWMSHLPPIVYEGFEVFGPACLEGRFFRVVHSRMQGGGEEWCCEVWSSGRWLSADHSPGCNAIMAATPATAEELLRAGVDCSPLPKEYDPCKVESEPEVEH
jgi:hypothetical protein